MCHGDNAVQIIPEYRSYRPLWLPPVGPLVLRTLLQVAITFLPARRCWMNLERPVVTVTASFVADNRRIVWSRWRSRARPGARVGIHDRRESGGHTFLICSAPFMGPIRTEARTPQRLRQHTDREMLFRGLLELLQEPCLAEGCFTSAAGDAIPGLHLGHPGLVPFISPCGTQPHCPATKEHATVCATVAHFVLRCTR
jgi:hypothetical protein